MKGRVISMRFEKISFEQWKKDWKENVEGIEDSEIFCEAAYERITIPTRATTTSAGYDFTIPYAFSAHYPKYGPTTPYNTKILTGIRWVGGDDHKPNLGLFLFVRSGMALKQGIQLANSVGVVDSDYYKADNEGHIMFVIKNDPAWPTRSFPAMTRIGQGVFLPFYLVSEDAATDNNVVRTGGFGSTGEN